MQFEIMQPGAFALLKLTLEANETIKAESDAMYWQIILIIQIIPIIWSKCL